MPKLQDQSLAAYLQEILEKEFGVHHLSEQVPEVLIDHLQQASRQLEARLLEQTPPETDDLTPLPDRSCSVRRMVPLLEAIDRWGKAQGMEAVRVSMEDDLEGFKRILGHIEQAIEEPTSSRGRGR